MSRRKRIFRWPSQFTLGFAAGLAATVARDLFEQYGWRALVAILALIATAAAAVSIWARAELIRAYLVMATYWIRPYDMLADQRRWRWQHRTTCPIIVINKEADRG